MRASLRFVMVVVEVLLFGYVLASFAQGQEFPSLEPAASPYDQRPVRVTLVNRDGQVSTLEYRRPATALVERDSRDLVPVSSLPIATAPQDEGLVSLEQTRWTTARYPGQPIVQTSATSLVPTGGCACNVPAAISPPVTAYSLPSYGVPVVGVPQTAYRPLVQQPLVPVAADLQVSRGIYGQPVIYRPGQPVRNALRWLTP